MRLLNTTTKIVEEVREDFMPPYAILSHTWGDEEVTLQDLQALRSHQDRTSPHPVQSRNGYLKIDGCCTLARNNGFEWVWIDTCCIDKTSSSELSEAINTMFRWYKEAVVCYVYLSDVFLFEDGYASESQFRQSRWFTRGWTLQELVAPKEVEFYDALWEVIGNRSTLRYLIQEIAEIPVSFFTNQSVYDASIAQRMSWAANRQTTRKEDLAYCLMGLFDVNMPLLYGEGDKAFRRLQEEIIKQSNDQSIFAWGFGQPSSGPIRKEEELAALAQWPTDFGNCGKVVPCSAWQPSWTISFEKVKAGISLELPLVLVNYNRVGHGIYGILNCRLTDNFSDLIAIPFGPPNVKTSENGAFYRIGKDLYAERCRHRPPILFNYSMWRRWSSTYTLIITEDRDLRRRALESQGYNNKHNSSSLIPVLVKEAQELFCFSAQLDPSLELVRGTGCTVLREKTPITHLGTTQAFLYYEKKAAANEENQTFIVKVEMSVTTEESGGCQLFVAARATSEELPTEDLQKLPWSQEVKSGKSTISIGHFQRRCMVLGIPMHTVVLTCNNSSPNLSSSTVTTKLSASLDLRWHLFWCDTDNRRSKIWKLAERIVLRLGCLILLIAGVVNPSFLPSAIMFLFVSLLKIRFTFHRVVIYFLLLVIFSGSIAYVTG